jgi:hypothetical protein
MRIPIRLHGPPGIANAFRLAMLLLLVSGASYAPAVTAQPEAAGPPAPAESSADGASGEPIDEITVRGDASLYALRMDVVEAREHVWDVFNEQNSNDELDVHCFYSTRTGTRMKKRTCRPQYAEDATSEAGKLYARRIQMLCPPGELGNVDPVCLEGAMATGSSEAQAILSRVPVMDERLDAEFKRLAVENPEIADAITNYFEKEQAYRDARARRRD